MVGGCTKDWANVEGTDKLHYCENLESCSLYGFRENSEIPPRRPRHKNVREAPQAIAHAKRRSGLSEDILSQRSHSHKG